MIRSSGAMEGWPREKLEEVYRFCTAGRYAPPLPQSTAAAVRTILRLLREQRHTPKQPPEICYPRFRLPYRGFVRVPPAHTLAFRLLRRTEVGEPANVATLAKEFGTTVGGVLRSLRALNRQYGYAVVEDRITGHLSIKREPLTEDTP